MIACRSCGASVDELALECPSCGTPLRAEMRGFPVLRAVGVVAAAAIVAASLVLRRPPAVEPFASPARQREAVERFHRLVVDGRWEDVYPLVAEPPAPDPTAFAALLREREASQGDVASIRIDAMQLRRSRTVPVLDVREEVRVRSGVRTETVMRSSVFVWHRGRWLFAFSAAG